jgi:peptidase M15-like protein
MNATRRLAGSRFTAADLAVSDSFPKLVEPIPEHLLANADRLSARVLEPLAEWADGQGLRMVFTSGYRGKRLNDAVGSSDPSLHRTADAADFILIDRKTGAQADWALPLAFQWMRGALWNNVGEVELGPNWLHVTNPVRGNLNEFLVKTGRTVRAVENPTGESLAVVALAFTAAALLDGVLR